VPQVCVESIEHTQFFFFFKKPTAVFLQFYPETCLEAITKHSSSAIISGAAAPTLEQVSAKSINVSSIFHQPFQLVYQH